MAKRASRPRTLLRHIPLRLAVGLAVALLVGSVVAMLSLSSYRGTQQAIAAATDDTIAQVATLLDEHLARTFEPADNQLRLLAYSDFGTADTPEAQLALLPLAREVLAGNRMVQAVFAGDTRGRFVLFRLLPDATTAADFSAPQGADMLVQVVARDATDGVAGSYHFFDASNNRLATRSLPGYAYDPRQRLWFEAARQANTTILTDPYRFYTTQAPGVTMARRSASGTAVIGLDIAFAQLSAHLDRLRLTPSGQVAIVDAEGRVVAHHAAMAMLTPADEERFRLANLTALGSPELQRAFHLPSAAPGQPAVQHGDDGWYRVRIPLAAVGELELSALLAVPDHEIFLDARRLLAMQLALAVVIFTLAVLVGLWLLRRPVSALRRIAGRTRAIEAFDMTPRPPVPSSIREIGQLGAAIARLRCTLASFLETSIALSQERDVESLLDKILNTVLQATHASGGAVYQFQAHQGMVPSRMQGNGLRQGNGLKQGSRERPPTTADGVLDTPADRRLVAQAATRRRTVTESRDGSLCVASPLLTREGRLLGAMLVWLPRAPQDDAGRQDTRVGFIEALSASAAVALENSQLLAGQREQLAQITYQASHDLLTGLPNRSAFTTRLETAAATCRQRHQRLAVLYLDLDGFKPINDGLGHAVGNQVLVAVAERLTALLGEHDSVARLVGDEFAILLVEAPPQAQIIALAERLLERLAQVYTVGEHRIHLSASLGIAWNQPPPAYPQMLLQQADLALEKAKRRGRNTWCWHQAPRIENARQQVERRRDLHLALQEQQLVLHYQPLVAAQDGRILGVEALVRWQHPRLGLLGPDAFIPLAEQTGQIIPLGRWVLQQACRELAELIERQGRAWYVAVNVSSLQLARGNFLEELQAALDSTGIPPQQLELEMTESMLIDSPEAAITLMRRIRELGVGVTLDDFGTGFSSLCYLRDLPARKVKLDRHFLQKAMEDPRTAAIVQGVIDMAHQMQMVVVAEGIETLAEHQAMQRRGCDLLQGYRFAHPLPLDALARLGDTLPERRE
ncbi:bifunctional diguanylate cyclase/phosphodiesterase [Halomonas sp.]|uniref:bifunctional diguanylate cyclase/phosphodiesterase n=1 Tax=Halomonas sp. TaxID=1486246 RepID=UPI003D0F3E2F